MNFKLFMKFMLPFLWLLLVFQLEPGVVKEIAVYFKTPLLPAVELSKIYREHLLESATRS